MHRWRERALREVRDELDRFLNYPINRDISLGDYGIYDGKHCRFEWQGNIADLGISPTSVGFQHEIVESYGTGNAVTVQGRLNIAGKNPAVDVSFSRTSALAFRGFKIGYDQVQINGLAVAFTEAIKGGLEWDRSKVIVTQLWRAEGFTHLVSGGGRSAVQIEATAPGAPVGFNFADASLGLNVLVERSMSYCAVGQTEVNPYFAIHKLRESKPGFWSLYSYGLSN